MPDVTFDQAMAEGARLEKAGQLPQAEALYGEIIRQIPSADAPLARLARIAYQTGRHAQAIDYLRRAVQLNPTSSDHVGNLGVVLAAAGQLPQAAEVLNQALQLCPNSTELYVNLGNVLTGLNQTDKAIAAFRNALRLSPNNSSAWFNLGNLYWELNRYPEAIEAQRKTVALQPNFAEAYHSLASALRYDGRMDEAISAFNRAIELKPDLGEAYTGLAATLQNTGRVREAFGYYRRAAELTDRPGVACALLVALHLDPDHDAKALHAEHAAFNRTFANPLAGEIQPHTNDRSPDRPLRVGFVSAYFSGRPVGRFLTPLFENYDQSSFAFVCYSDVRNPDATTSALRGRATLWRDVSPLEDADIARLVREDRIDVLIDLGMHTRWNRILAFARKPAPIQITYLAYCGTTGLDSIDYRISDPYLDPTNDDQPYYSERTIRLTSYWCYPAPAVAPPINALPAASNGVITFGCLNDFGKVSDLTLSLWARILGRLPGSRLILHCWEGTHRSRVLSALAAEGVSGERVSFLGMQPIGQYFATYHQIDLALDPTPWCGGTTTCDALYMGVPVVTLAGKTAVSRGGASILGQLGHSDWVAHTSDEYVNTALALAGNQHLLSDLRASLRQRMLHSRLMDGPAFTGEFQDLLRTLWRKWCASERPVG